MFETFATDLLAALFAALAHLRQRQAM
jgi:hypothetical protein